MTRTLKEFFDTSKDWIKETKQSGKDPCFTINPTETPKEWAEWSAYFLSECGQLPLSMKMVLSGNLKSFTTPARLPQWITSLRYAPSEGVIPRPQRDRPARFRDGHHIDRMREWLSRRAGRSVAELVQLSEHDRVSLGFTELQKELQAAAKSSSMSMKNPHPLPKERISDG